MRNCTITYIASRQEYTAKLQKEKKLVQVTSNTSTNDSSTLGCKLGETVYYMQYTHQHLRLHRRVLRLTCHLRSESAQKAQYGSHDAPEEGWIQS